MVPRPMPPAGTAAHHRRMVERTGSHRCTTGGAWRTLVSVTTMAAVVVGVVATSSAPVEAASRPAGVTLGRDDDWLGVVNAYRAMSGLGPVREDARWSAQGRDHSCYMLRNGMSHDEVPGAPGYTAGGDEAGNSGNVAVSSNVAASARSHIDLWMTGPFHAIGILRAGLRTTGFGLCADPTTNPWRSGATLDVIRGIDPGVTRPGSPVVFPGPGATVRMGAFITESPDPVAMCGWTGTPAGLPLIAVMPARTRTATATLEGPNGPVEICVLHAGNTPDAHARAILAADDAVVVVPRVRLAPGTYHATVTAGAAVADWSFSIDPTAPLVAAGGIDLPDTRVTSAATTFRAVTPHRVVDTRSGLGATRLRAGVPQTIELGDAGAVAVSANFTVDRPAGPGFLTVYPCTPTIPTVSTSNFTASPVPNQAVVPIAGGRVCAVSSVDADLLVDVNGWYAADGGLGLRVLTPRRLVDTRADDRPLQPGEVRRVAVEGVDGGAPNEAAAIAVNLTAAGPQGDGFLRAFPCDDPAGESSNVNVVAGRDRANSAVVRTAADGTICVTSTVTTHLLVDVTGALVPGAGTSLRTVEPRRLLDTRSGAVELNPATAGTRVAPDQVVRLVVAGRRGVPADALAAVVNVTAVDPTAAGFVTVVPCGEVPVVSTLNVDPTVPAIANGAVVGLDAGGAMCLVADHPVHLLVDVVGVWA